MSNLIAALKGVLADYDQERKKTLPDKGRLRGAQQAIIDFSRQLVEQAGLTSEELKVLNHLAEAWNYFIQLPTYHPMHNTEMAQAIHAAQRIILQRPTSRLEGRIDPERPFNGPSEAPIHAQSAEPVNHQWNMEGGEPVTSSQPPRIKVHELMLDSPRDLWQVANCIRDHNAEGYYLGHFDFTIADGHRIYTMVFQPMIVWGLNNGPDGIGEFDDH